MSQDPLTDGQDAAVHQALMAASVADRADEELRGELRLLLVRLLPHVRDEEVPGAWEPALRALRAFAGEDPPAPPPGALARLGEALDLSPAERLLITAALSPDLDWRMGRLWQLLSDDRSGTRPRLGTLALLWEGAEAGEVLDLLGQDQALIALQLLEFGPARDGAPLSRALLPLAPLSAFMAAGPGHVPPRPGHGVRLHSPGAALADALPPDLDGEQLLSTLRGVFPSPPARASNRRRTPPPAALCLAGPPGSGRGYLAEALAGGLGLGLCHLILDPEGSRQGRAVLLRTAILHGAVPCIEVPEGQEGLLPELLGFVGAVYSGPLFLLSVDPPSLPDPFSSLLIPVSRSFSRAVLFRRALGPAADEELVREVARRFPISRGGVFRAARNAAARSLSRGGVPDQATLMQAAREELVERSSLAERIRTSRRLSDLVAPPETLDLIREIVAFARHRKVVVDGWGFNLSRGFRLGLKVLFSGPPGTGKTLAAEIIAAELDLDLFRIDLSAVVSKWIGETEKNLRQVFDQAELGGGILLFDEADSLFGKRTADVKSSVDRYANLEVNYLLQRMEAFEGIVLLTTNLDSAIDDAFRRRLNFRVRFNAPDEHEREVLWRKMIPDQAQKREPLDFAALAQRFDMPGGNIRNAALRGAFLAASAGSALATEHLILAAERELSEIGRIVSDRRR